MPFLREKGGLGSILTIRSLSSSSLTKFLKCQKCFVHVNDVITINFPKLAATLVLLFQIFSIVAGP